MQGNVPHVACNVCLRGNDTIYIRSNLVQRSLPPLSCNILRSHTLLATCGTLLTSEYLLPESPQSTYSCFFYITTCVHPNGNGEIVDVHALKGQPAPSPGQSEAAPWVIVFIEG